jgi:translation initiation factor IF-3
LTNFKGGIRRRGERPVTTSQEEHRLNNQISAREVRLIGQDGAQLGIVSLREALERAEAAGLDLAEIAPEASPPVCKILDYGKLKYREQKKEAEARKKRTENIVKELRIRYRTDVGDLETKLKHARDFLGEGDKVKFSMRFKGREVMYVDLGDEKFKTIIERLSDVATVDEKSPLTGKQIYIVLAPLKGSVKKSA